MPAPSSISYSSNNQNLMTSLPQSTSRQRPSTPTYHIEHGVNHYLWGPLEGLRAAGLYHDPYALLSYQPRSLVGRCTMKSSKPLKEFP